MSNDREAKLVAGRSGPDSSPGDRISQLESAVLDNLPFEAVLIDHSGMIVATNDPWRQFAIANGFSGGDFGLGDNYLAVCDCAEGQFAREAFEVSTGFRSVLAGERQHFTIEYPCHSPTEQRWFLLKASPLSLDGFSGALVVHVDITERKLAETALQDSQVRLQAILDHEPDSVRVVGLNAEVLEINPAGLHIFEADRAEDIVGHDISRFVLPSHRHDILDLHEIALAGGHGELHYPVRGLKGTERWLETKTVPLPDTAGSVSATLFIDRDITRRLELEGQLHQSQRLELVGQLAGGLAHDFNNLLTVILGNARAMVREASGNSRLQETAEVITGASQRAATLTQRLLAFSRKQILTPEVVDVCALVVDLHKLLQRTLGSHIEFEFFHSVHEAGLCQVMVDRQQFESALVNLCLNARDAMPGGGRLVIEIANKVFEGDCSDRLLEAGRGRYVMVSVSDNGTGIEADALARVFEPFYTTKEVGKGTGLGLTMVHGFIKQSRGHIDISSELGKGTTVKLYLPAYTRDKPAEESAALPATGYAGTGEEMPHLAPAAILVVEDDVLVRRFVTTEMKALGYQVVEAGNGPEALDVIRSRDDIDLLFTDIVMPGGMNGNELAAEATALRPGLKVLFTTGYTEYEVAFHGLENLHASVLTKPFSPEELVRHLRGVLGGDA